MGATLDQYWALVARNTDRARRRLLRSEWFRNHSFDEPGGFERDGPLGDPSDDEDSPALVHGTLPFHAFLGDASSSSDSDEKALQIPDFGGMPLLIGLQP